jgi:hypothetical protein
VKDKRTFLLILLALCPLLVACGTLEIGIERTSTPGPVATSAPSTLPTPLLPTTSPLATPLPDPASYLGVEREGGELGNVWTLADVRYGLHLDRVQIVIEMTEPGDHVPKFQIVEVDNAASPFPTGHDPSWGAARIDLIVADLYDYDFPVGQLPLTLPDNPLVTRVGLYPTFSDAHLGFSIGLKEPASYKVYEFTYPVRIVISVLYPPVS